MYSLILFVYFRFSHNSDKYQLKSKSSFWLLPHLEGITAEAETNVDRDHAAGTERRRPGHGQDQGPNTAIIAEVAVRAGGHN